MTTTDTRVALVTGGPVVERLVQDGVAVAIHYAGNRARAEGVAAKVREAGGQAIIVGGGARPR
ncbi:MAG: hypothetical protein ACRDRN_04835 [Sciscionella sp.]